MKRTSTLLALLLTSGLATATAFAGPNGAKASHPHKKDILQKYDTNKDGTLDANEKAVLRADRAAHRKAHKAHKSQRRAAMLQRFDTNQNGVLDAGERQAAIVERSNQRFDKMLVKLDANGDKMLSMAELAAKAGKAGKAGKAAKAAKAGKARGPGMAKQRFAKVDTNNDGLITRAEFRQAALTRATNMKARRGHRQGKGVHKPAPAK
ncbi:MAG TPA: hypothetical protein VML75_15015 [Kofleriaceae bacterium]|nr:hypothetical protein [Kofleriaceae bacterium]